MQASSIQLARIIRPNSQQQPRFANGVFNFTDPRHCSIHDPIQATCFLNAQNHDGFYEGAPIVVRRLTNLSCDKANLIRFDPVVLAICASRHRETHRSAGREGEVRVTIELHLQSGECSHARQRRYSRFYDDHQGYFDSTDEPSQQIPFMYHYANRPGLSTQRSRQVIAEFYNTSINGLPGNDGTISTPLHDTRLLMSPYADSGAMGSYVAFYLAGLYPLPATRQFLLSSPYFREISFQNPVLKTTTTIRANGFHGNPKNGTGGHVFVQVGQHTLRMSCADEVCTEREDRWQAVEVKLLYRLGRLH